MMSCRSAKWFHYCDLRTWQICQIISKAECHALLWKSLKRTTDGATTWWKRSSLQTRLTIRHLTPFQGEQHYPKNVNSQKISHSWSQVALEWRKSNYCLGVAARSNGDAAESQTPQHDPAISKDLLWNKFSMFGDAGKEMKWYDRFWTIYWQLTLKDMAGLSGATLKVRCQPPDKFLP